MIEHKFLSGYKGFAQAICNRMRVSRNFRMGDKVIRKNIAHPKSDPISHASIQIILDMSKLMSYPAYKYLLRKFLNRYPLIQQFKMSADLYPIASAFLFV